MQEEEDEDTKDMDANAESVIERCSNLVEAKYLMQHLFNYSLEQSVSATKFEAANKVGNYKYGRHLNIASTVVDKFGEKKCAWF